MKAVTGSTVFKHDEELENIVDEFNKMTCVNAASFKNLLGSKKKARKHGPKSYTENPARKYMKHLRQVGYDALAIVATKYSGKGDKFEVRSW